MSGSKVRWPKKNILHPVNAFSVSEALGEDLEKLGRLAGGFTREPDESDSQFRTRIASAVSYMRPQTTDRTRPIDDLIPIGDAEIIQFGKPTDTFKMAFLARLGEILHKRNMRTVDIGWHKDPNEPKLRVTHHTYKRIWILDVHEPETIIREITRLARQRHSMADDAHKRYLATYAR